MQASLFGHRLSGFLAFGLIALTMSTPSQAATPKGLGEPGQLVQMRLEPNKDGKGVLLRGRDGRQQLIATGIYSTGQLRDETRKVQYSVEPADIVQIDSNGHMTPLKDGRAVIKAIGSGIAAELSVEVTGLSNDIPVNFPTWTQDFPAFTRPKPVINQTRRKVTSRRR